jgi:AraC-like DNA-binding protein
METAFADSSRSRDSVIPESGVSLTHAESDDTTARSAETLPPEAMHSEPAHRASLERAVELVSARIDVLSRELESQGLSSAKDELCMALTASFELGGLRAPTLQRRADRSEWLKRAKELLEQNPGGHVDCQEIATELGLSYEGFRKRFATMTGLSPGQYRGRYVIEQACTLMRQTELSNREIADRLGFVDGGHFARRFKRFMGVTPSDYRRSSPRSEPGVAA